MKERFIQGLSSEGFHRVYYRDYGDKTAEKTLVCVHGLTRNSSDFHFLAETLKEDFRVIVPDVVGRGKSDCFTDASNYSYVQYLSDMNALLQRLDTESVDWLGTSMGGLFGMILAAQPRTPVRRLILNDIGPFIPAEAIARIKMYASTEVIFESREQADETLQVAYSPFGPMSEEHWDYLFTHSLKEVEDGYTLTYDPRAINAAKDKSHEEDHNQQSLSQDSIEDVTFWEFWDKITCPVLVINGRESDILPPKVIEQMSTRGPDFQHVYIEEAGHAPSLMPTDQIDVVQKWLKETA